MSAAQMTQRAAPASLHGGVVLLEIQHDFPAKEEIPEFQGRQPRCADREIRRHDFGLGGRMRNACLLLALASQHERGVRAGDLQDNSKRGATRCQVACKISITKQLDLEVLWLVTDP